MEVIVAITVIAAFSIVMIVNFPQIQRRYALANATYKLAQDLRRAEDLGLSGLSLKNSSGDNLAVKGYGVYLNTAMPQKYIVYAIMDSSKKFFSGDFNSTLCSAAAIAPTPALYCIVDLITLPTQIYILQPMQTLAGANLTGNRTYTSINFTPPDPIVNIDNLGSGQTGIEITLGMYNDNSLTRKVQITSAGLINIK